MAGPRASLQIHGPLAGRVEQAIGTLYAIELAYNNLYIVNAEIDRIYDLIGSEEFYPTKFRWPLDLAIRYPARVDLRQWILPEDVLELGVIKFESPGFWEFLGALNPLEQIRQYLSDRHERKKDNEFRNRTEQTKRDLENERLAAKVMFEKIEVLEKAGFSTEEIRRFISPSVHALDSVANAQDEGFIGFSELKRIEDQSSQG